MTLLECKNEVAKKNGFYDWADLQNTWLTRVGLAKVVHEDYVERVAELYARSKWDEAIDASIKKFELAKTNAKHFVEIVQLDAVLAILEVTRKEFKP